MSFVHLLNHSEYSMLQATSRTKAIISNAHKDKQASVALTDNGNMFGALEFYFNAQYTVVKEKDSEGNKVIVDPGVKPVIGCHIYVDPQGSGFNESYKYDRLVILAENQEGYQSLTKIVTYGHLEGFDQKPLIPLDFIKENSKGLIALYGGVDCLYAKHSLRSKPNEAMNWINAYQSIFDRDHFFLMLQDHGRPEEITLCDSLRTLSQTHNAQLVVTNNNHYSSPDDAEAHEVLQCIEKKESLKAFLEKKEKGEDEAYNSFPTKNYYQKTTQEMIDLFPNDEEARLNSVKIADRCNISFKTQPEIGDAYWPKFKFPEGFDNSDDYLAHFTWEKVHERYPEVDDRIRDRINTELRIMAEMKVSGYMLIVQDFINWARDNDIPVGPGRGSAVGSVVCYIIGIVDIDPLKFDLLFERFLNPERVSMPDIDTDFSDKDREKVIQYVTDFYGKECVSQVVTYGRLKAKAVLKDVARVYEADHNEINKLTKFLPALLKGLQRPASKALPPGQKGEDYADDFDEIKEAFIEGNTMMRKIWEQGLRLEGLVRQPGIHAAAVIIAPKPLTELAPLYKAPGEDAIVIQYDKTYAEDVGFLKMDFLGLRNLSVIKDTVALVKEQRNEDIDPAQIDIADAATYELLGKGLTVGVFQFESGGMQNYLRQLKPNNIEDMIAMNALYRPGPIAQIPNFIKRKKDPNLVDTYHDRLANILGDTYGIIVYQEQVMLIAQQMSGFSLGGADILRRIMAKKKADQMAIEMPKFLDGAVSNEYPLEVAEKIWEDLGPFCAYAFNKSHSAAYAYVGYQTAYLKAHYGPEFMAANMSSEIDSTDRLVILLNECKNLQIGILAPNVNRSKTMFSVLEGKINYGLAGIKNVGAHFIDLLVEERESNGPYKSLFDLCKRLATSNALNRKALESLIMAGALDELAGNRAQQYSSVDLALNYASQAKKDAESGQVGLFDDAFSQEDTGMKAEPDLKPAVAWPEVALLEKEKEVMGLYITGHPLETVRMELNGFTTGDLSAEAVKSYAITERKGYGQRGKDTEENVVILGGFLARLATRMDKHNRAFAFGTLEDFVGKIDVRFTPDIFENIQGKFDEGSMVLIKGIIQYKAVKDEVTEKWVDSEEKQLIAKQVEAIEDARLKWTQYIHIRFSGETSAEADLRELDLICSGFVTEDDDLAEGEYIDHGYTESELVFHITFENNTPPIEHVVICNKYRVTPEKDLLNELKDHFGFNNVWISAGLN